MTRCSTIVGSGPWLDCRAWRSPKAPGEYGSWHCPRDCFAAAELLPSRGRAKSQRSRLPCARMRIPVKQLISVDSYNTRLSWGYQARWPWRGAALRLPLEQSRRWVQNGMPTCYGRVQARSRVQARLAPLQRAHAPMIPDTCTPLHKLGSNRPANLASAMGRLILQHTRPLVRRSSRDHQRDLKPASAKPSSGIAIFREAPAVKRWLKRSCLMC